MKSTLLIYGGKDSYHIIRTVYREKIIFPINMVWHTIIYTNTKSDTYNTPSRGLISFTDDDGKHIYQLISSNLFKTEVEMKKQPNFPMIKDNIVELISVPDHIQVHQLFDRLTEVTTLAQFNLSEAVIDSNEYFCISSSGKYSFSTSIDITNSCVYCVRINQL